VSFPVLDVIAEALEEHPTISFEVQAHTDSQGDDAANVALTQSRAEAVVRYLVQHGIEPSRLTAKGYGETRPIESNRTSQGREVNRRVELIRTDVSH
jgi:outer membrane protein OmpA-like peptidoglycan-associated protein